MTQMYYPLVLDLNEKHCLVVGGGTIATEKVEGLLPSGAWVTVVSPSASAVIAALAEAGTITWQRRPYRRSDLDGVYLAYGATDDRAANAEVTRHARNAGILVNAVDDIPNCDFFAVSVVRRGDLQVAISTNGKSPAFAHWMRVYLDAALSEEHADLLRVLAEVRLELKVRGPVPAYEYWDRAISEDVLLRLRHGDVEGARRQIHGALVEAQDFELQGAAASHARWAV